MAEGFKARVVRCPKCENLLQEPPDYSVYKCGGCGAVLKAKKKASGSDGFSEKSDEQRVRGGSETLECLSEKEGGSLGSASETERGSDGIEVNRRKGRIFAEKTGNFIGNSLLKSDYKEVLIDSDRIGSEEIKDLRLEQSGVEKEIGFVDRYRQFSERPVDNLSTKENLVHIKNSAESLRLGASMDWWRVKGDGFGGTYGNSRAVAEHGGYPTFAYPDEGPSNYKPDSFYGYGERKKNRDDLDVPHRVENLEHNRAELLRKLDELKDQLSRSSGVEDKPRVPVDRTSPDPYGGRDIYNVSTQPSAPDKHLPRPPYINHGTTPFMNRHNMDMLNCYPPPRHVVNENSAFEDPYQPQMMRRPPHQPPSQYPQRPPHEYFLGQYMEFNQDPFASYPHETFLHQPTCSCLHCYDHNWQVPPRVAPIVFSNRRIQKDPSNSSFYQHVNLGQQSYNPRAPNPPQLYSRDSQVHTRWPSDIDSDIDGFGQSHSRRVVVAHGNGRICYPIGGGAPFIACYNCFELLKLPSKLLMLEKNQRKLRCGACSTIIMFEIKNKKLIISVPTELNQISVEDDEGSCEVLNESLLSSNGCLNAHDNNPCSDDFDNPGYNFKLTEDNGLDSSKSEKRQGLTSSSSISSEEEESLDSVIVQGDVSNSAAQPSRDDLSPMLRGSPFQDHSDCPPDHAVSKNGQGNNSKRVDQDKVVLNRATSRQNSVNDASMVTELEVSFNDYLNSSLSQDSVEVSKEENQPKVDKGTDSFLMGLIKKSFKDFSRSTSVENERPNVLINGQPIPDRMVKKAEKLAGSIQPGDYWYDFRGGFWGVMGQPCLGIIPPLIEEFNYPMPTNCGAGNTGVFVNGRELHQKDLDLLACRGLPTTRDKFYILEISGRIVDEDSGKELDSLGKLAPTVEKVKCGFGMKTTRKVM